MANDEQYLCLKESPLENIVLQNEHLKLDGDVKECKKDIREETQDYPEVYVYGRILPAKGICRAVKFLSFSSRRAT